MLGAIIGDIIGSVYEFDNIKSKEFPLFDERCCFTDDTVMTIAVAEALMNGGSEADFIRSMKKWGRMYPNAGYGGKFGAWIRSKNDKPYNSWGNGSAMRVSPCAWFASSLEEAENLAEKSAAVTHNHPEGIKGAKATAAAIFLARQREKVRFDSNRIKAKRIYSDDEIKAHIEDTYNYDLSRTLDEIRPSYKFNESCQETVPEAIIAFLESNSFEDAIRNAVSLGGDSDTLAAITGSIAEAAYGIPDDIKKKALNYLDSPILNVCEQLKDFLMSDAFIKEVDITDTNNNNRFVINVGDLRFLDESGNVVPPEELKDYLAKRKAEYDAIPKRDTSKFEFHVKGDIVRIHGVDNPITIVQLFIIHEKGLYDYGGYEIVDGVNTEVVHLFQHEEIIEN